MKRLPSYVVVVSAALALTALTAGSGVHAQSLEERIAKLEATVATLQDQVDTLQTQLAAVQSSNVLALDPFVSVDPNPELGVTGPHIIFSGANIHIVSGSDVTDDGGTPRGLGNLIIGYDEDPAQVGSHLNPGDRGGSHNLVIGRFNRFTRAAFGGLVVGESNTISGRRASVSGGFGNTASGFGASVSGGAGNTASGALASVSGGQQNTARGQNASVSGGLNNTASGIRASVSGGQQNTASGFGASVSGGLNNTASGARASVSGGQQNTASANSAVVLGGTNITNNNANSIAPQPPFP
jgi:hypothetical protein